MPREKTTRNPHGTILKKEIEVTEVVRGKEKKVKRTVYDARKRYTDPEGNQKEKFKRCRTFEQATSTITTFVNEIREEFIKSVEKEAEQFNYTFFQLCEYFRANYCKPPVFIGKRQISGYRQNYKNIETYLDEFKEFFGDVKLSEITYERVRAYAEHVATTPIRSIYGKEDKKLPEASTVNRKLSYLRRLFNVGIRARYIPTRINPFSEGEPLIRSKNEAPRKRALTFEEEKKLLAVCGAEKWPVEFIRYKKKHSYEIDNPSPHMKLVVIIAIDAGLRKSEIFTLQREDIDLDKKIIFLPWKKTKALTDRAVPMSERLENEFRAYFKKYAFTPKAEIFFGQKDCKKTFASACERAGIKGFRFHDLRHTAATWMNEAGIPEITKRAIVGHTSAAVHERYHELTSDVVESIRKKMNNFRETIEKESEPENPSEGAKILSLGKS